MSLRLKLGRREWRPQTRVKFGIYHASVSEEQVIAGKSTGLYFEGTCTAQRIMDEVILKVKASIHSGHDIHLPLAVKSYRSKGRSLSEFAQGGKRQPDPASFQFEFLIDTEYRVIRLSDNGTILPSG